MNARASAGACRAPEHARELDLPEAAVLEAAVGRRRPAAEA